MEAKHFNKPHFTYNFNSPNDNVLPRVNNIRREYLTPYRAVKYDCVKLKGLFSHNSVIPCILDTRYIIAL